MEIMVQILLQKTWKMFSIFYIWKYPPEIWNSLYFTFEICSHMRYNTWDITHMRYNILSISHTKSLLKFAYMKDWNLCTSHMKSHPHTKSVILYISDIKICAVILLHKIWKSVYFTSEKSWWLFYSNIKSVYVTYENLDADFSPRYIESFRISLYKNLDAIILTWNVKFSIHHIWKFGWWFS